MKRFAFLLVIVAAVSRAQTPTGPTGSVSGRVIDADTHAPIAGAKVGSPKLGWTPTVADGRFTIRNLAPGPASIEVNYTADANIDDVPAIPKNVNVIAGRETTGVDFTVWLDGGISGRVTDENNEPLSGISVTVFYTYYRANSAPGSFDNSDNLLNSSVYSLKLTTDDRGMYSLRSSFMRAGRSYWVLAERERTDAGALSDAPANPEARRRTLVPTFYPNAASMSAATPIVLHSLEQRTGVDIRMVSSPSYCIDGTVKIEGQPGRINFAVEEETRSSMHYEAGIPRRGASTGDDGRFRVCNLASGPYQLTAFGKGLPYIVDEFATRVVNIGNADVHNVELNAVPPATLNVELRWSDTPPAGTGSASLRVQSLPYFRTTATVTGPPAIRVPGETSFQILPTLRQGISISNLAAPYYVKNIELDGQSVLYQTFDSGTGSRRLRITIGRDAGNMKVQTDAPGVSVFVIPQAAQSEAELANSLFKSCDVTIRNDEARVCLKNPPTPLPFSTE